MTNGPAGGSLHSHKHRDEEEQKDLIRRLNRIEGQIRGIRNMVEKMPTVWTF